MIAMGGLGENKWDGLGQCLHTPTILQGDEQLNANYFDCHHHHHHPYNSASNYHHHHHHSYNSASQ